MVDNIKTGQNESTEQNNVSANNKSDTAVTNDIANKILPETDVERAFKEGLANNSDTDKNTQRQK